MRHVGLPHSLPTPRLGTDRRAAAALVIAIVLAVLVACSPDLAMHVSAWLSAISVVPGSYEFWLLHVGYACILAVPFIPSLELGLVLMALSGTGGIIAVYLATVCGLIVPYLVGRALAAHRLGKAPWSESERLPGYAHHKGELRRSIALAIALNTPGNFVIGGGGAIAFASGGLRLLSTLPYCLTVALATLPVPLPAYAGVFHLTQ